MRRLVLGLACAATMTTVVTVAPLAVPVREAEATPVCDTAGWLSSFDSQGRGQDMNAVLRDWADNNCQVRVTGRCSNGVQRTDQRWKPKGTPSFQTCFGRHVLNYGWSTRQV
jgi:hypothetical protein